MVGSTVVSDAHGRTGTFVCYAASEGRLSSCFSELQPTSAALVPSSEASCRREPQTLRRALMRMGTVVQRCLQCGTAGWP